jgi:hypothetical protein
VWRATLAAALSTGLPMAFGNARMLVAGGSDPQAVSQPGDRGPHPRSAGRGRRRCRKTLALWRLANHASPKSMVDKGLVVRAGQEVGDEDTKGYRDRLMFKVLESDEAKMDLWRDCGIAGKARKSETRIANKLLT